MDQQKTNENRIYSDGPIEDRILSYLKNQSHDTNEIIRDLPEGAVFHNFTSARAGLLQWYPFEKDATVLEIGAGMGALTPQLASQCGQVVAIEPSLTRAAIVQERCKDFKNVCVLSCDIKTYQPQTLFDYVLLIGVLEYAAISDHEGNPWFSMLTSAKKLLKPTGKLLLAIENQYGMKYWCGAAEDHTGIPFDSLNDYAFSRGKTQRYESMSGVRTFHQQELRELLHQAGFPQIEAYYPFPDYKFPTLILRDHSPAAESLLKGVKFHYPEESTLIANEQQLFPAAVRNGCLGFFANSFLLEAAVQPQTTQDITAVSLKRDYREEYRLVTILHPDRVTRRAASPKSEAHLRSLIENTRLLEQRGVPCLSQSECANGDTTAVFASAPCGDEVFRAAVLDGNQSLWEELLRQIKDALVKSGGEMCDHGRTLRDGFLDLTLRNSFWVENRLVFFDQEWKQSEVPLKYLLYRSIRYALPENISPEMVRSIYQTCDISEVEAAEYDVREDEFLRSLMDECNCSWFDRTQYQSRLTLSAKHTAELKNRDAHIAQLLQSERDLKATIAEKDCRLAEQTATIAEQTATIAEQSATIAEQSATIAEQSATIAEQSATIAEQSATLARDKQTIRNRDGQILQLLEPERELNRIKASRSWRFMGYFWKLRDALIPKGSKRRLLGKMLVKFVKHPLRFLSKCTPHKISKFFKTLHREGVEDTSRRLDDCLIGNAIPTQELTIQAVPAAVPDAPPKTTADYAPLHVPQWDKPTVSIVIPVYNQFDFTYACVKSILQNSGEMTYEILIADDCSTDVTREIDRVITGLRTIHNEENLRFLLNCNHAAAFAKGEYILFLNNDTQVQKNWLAPLVSLMEKDSTIGMTGSKLVYPDGRLQEAGGIFWKDASAWNYGNRSDPAEPEYNYVKDVDYISGASICIRKTLWEEIGGFDQRFVPAYCEDSDLAFEVRSHGYRVVYQPLSVVVHFEGVSNGTDTSTGQKQYQVINQKKFHEKWKDVLEREHFPNGKNVFQARDRSRNKKVLLMVDHYVPQYDKDAGSRTVFAYLKLFAENGYQVKFIGDNFYPHQPYTQTLQQLGIEVLYGPYYAKNWQDWLKENGACIGYAFLNRPHISEKYIDAVRKLTPARIVYYGHDLHFLREQREYELTGDSKTLKSSEEWKEKELDLMHRADMSYYPSCVEEEAIHGIDRSIQVKAIPAYLFDNIQEIPYTAQGRKDLMFIGGFGHHPNVDGVKWLAAEILPTLSELLPGVQVHILGSNPPLEIKALESDVLHIAGFVTDEELAEYYRTCRLVIVPLRYGAGIKGKVVEAMRYGMPVVTTSIGAEGIAGAENILDIADAPEDFARVTAALYNNPASLMTRSAQSYQYIRENFSPENAKQVIGPEFDMK
ncbi:glycosyltransferase [Oscillibacter sp.]|uniref:glycosyltransferase n=1 Tax=Oscillibacter sp. TaxID=1945593 RepID=UPI002606A165|nr:glycosyltransferase [Oscillibacter sp.]MDD3346465.1 glycosyltransferase [Oscillibacter sp.]